MSIEERLVNARKKKEEGNVELQKGDYKKASFLYKQVHMFIGEYIKLSPSTTGKDAPQVQNPMVNMFSKNKTTIPLALQQEIEELYVATQCNLALAHIKLQRYPEAKNCCEVALQLSKGVNVKAHFRKGQALMFLGMLDEARLELSENCDVADVAVQELLAMIQQRFETARLKEKKMFSKMFSE